MTLSITADVKAELHRVAVTDRGVMNAELASTLRYTSGLYVVGRQIHVEAEFSSQEAADRADLLAKTLYNMPAQRQSQGSHATRRNPRFLLRWTDSGTELARRTELIDRAGRPVQGLPRFIIGGTKEQCAAAWRGAFLAHGTLNDPGRSVQLDVVTPSDASALALVGAARRLEIAAKNREVRGKHRVLIKDGEAIAALLQHMGVTDVVAMWNEQRMKRETRSKANRLANFDDANLRRSARAASKAAAQAERALLILDGDVPDNLLEAGRLRIAHRDASLEELGRLASPQMTKDAIAGRIRRLISLANKRAEELGIPDTNAAVTEELLETWE